MKDETDWKACPFCGGRVVIGRDIDGAVAVIFCTKCKAYIKWNIRMKGKETFGENQEKWAEKWNRRTRGSDQ